MDSKETLSAFKAVADSLVHNIRTEWRDLKSKWAPLEADVIDRFEAMKQSFSSSLHQIEKQVAGWKDTSQEPLQDIRRLMDELRLQLSLGKAEGLEAFEEQKQKITDTWKKLRNRLEDRSEFAHMESDLKKELMEWRIKMDMMKIQFSLGKMELKDRWKDIYEELGREAENLGKVVEAGAGIAAEKIDQFDDELKKIYRKYK